MNGVLKEIYRVDPDNPLEYCREIIAPFAIDKLNENILKCNHCKTCSDTKVAYKGNPNANILIIADNATDNEEVYNYLNTLIETSGINLDDVFIANAVSCVCKRKVSNDEYKLRLPSKEEAGSCKLFLSNAIKIVNPTVILIMGATALNMFKDSILNEMKHGWVEIYGIPAKISDSVQDIFACLGLEDDDLIQERTDKVLEDLMAVNTYIQQKRKISIGD